jgi:hypothetical protein
VRVIDSETGAMDKARLAGLFYLLTFITGGLALATSGRVSFVVGLCAGACYLVVTVLLYQLFKPVDRAVSFIAAVVSLIGIAAGPLQWKPVNPLVFFGVYCLLLSYLIIKSRFLPSVVGALLAVAGLGWLTFLSPWLTNMLYPYNIAPGIIGEGALTVWLLVRGLTPK